MKAINSLLVLATLTTTASADEADQLVSNLETQIQQAWYRDSETRVWLLADAASNAFKPAPCSDLFVKLANLGVPMSRTIELYDESRDLPKGVHTLAAAKRACDGIEYAGKIKEVERWITMAAESDSVNNRSAFGHCMTTYADAIAAGIKPTDRVPQRKIRIGHDLVMWSGTIEELKTKYCDAGFTKIQDELRKRETPYRKVLKNDKLSMALGFNVTAVYVLPGADKSMNPAKLASAKVWFDSTSAPSNERQTCTDGRRRTLVRRYEFDKEQRLVKTTQKEYCGEAIYR